MTGKKKIGVEVDGDLYNEFREFVRDKTGRTRGVLGSHLERAMSEYMKHADDGGPAARVEQDLATVNRNVAENRELLRELATAVDGVEADGGSRTLSGGDCTHTHRDPADTVDRADSSSEADTNTSNDAVDETSQDVHRTVDEPNEPPAPKASRMAKAEWLAAQFPDGDEFMLDDLTKAVDETYSFGENATAKLVEATLKRLDHEPHPNLDELYVPPERAEKLREEQVDEISDVALTNFDDLAAGHPESDTGDAVDAVDDPADE